MLIVVTHQCGIAETREPLGGRKERRIIKIPPIVTGTGFGTPILNQFLIIEDVIGEIKTHRTFQLNLSSGCKDLHSVFNPSLVV